MGPQEMQIMDWLMEGDPAIRWQVMRDLLHAPEAEWQVERQKTASEGWGAAFLSHQGQDDIWGGGVYSPKWISSTYTLLTLKEIGVPRETAACQRGLKVVMDQFFGPVNGANFARNLKHCDLCISGMFVGLGLYFRTGDERLGRLQEQVLETQLVDGGWNCRWNKEAIHHSSFHTMLNILDGIRQWIEEGSSSLVEEAVSAEKKAMELLLQHGLFRSSQTGEVINRRFLLFSHPVRWYYDVFRALEYFQRAGAGQDERLAEAVEVLQSKRLKDGRWPVQNRHAGKQFFVMEKTGQPSRWNTLRALRILRWWEAH